MLEINFVSELGGKALKGLSRVVLATVEAPVDEALDARPSWAEESCDGQRRAGDNEVVVLLTS